MFLMNFWNKSESQGMRQTKVNHVGLNAEQDLFVVGTENGLRLFNVAPLVLVRSLDKNLVGNVSFCTVLHRSNLVLFVGAPNSKFPNNTVFIWDDKNKEIVLEVTVTGGPILNVLFSFSRIVVIQSTRLHIFHFPNPCKLLRTEEIPLNPKGLAALSSDHSNPLLAYPGFKLGSVQMFNLNQITETSSLHPNTIDAHQNEIAQMALNKQGTLLATGSAKGTVIRVFNTRDTKTVLLEYRRGADPAGLHCMQFSPCSTFLAVSSDKGTIHIFACRDSKARPQGSKKGLLQQIVPSEQRSIAQVSLEPRVLGIGFVAGTSTSMQSLVALCQDGTYHRYSFGFEGQPNREGFDYFMQLGDEQEFWTQPF